MSYKNNAKIYIDSYGRILKQDDTTFLVTGTSNESAIELFIDKEINPSIVVSVSFKRKDGFVISNRKMENLGSTEDGTYYNYVYLFKENDRILDIAGQLELSFTITEYVNDVKKVLSTVSTALLVRRNVQPNLITKTEEELYEEALEIVKSTEAEINAIKSEIKFYGINSTKIYGYSVLPTGVEIGTTLVSYPEEPSDTLYIHNYVYDVATNGYKWLKVDKIRSNAIYYLKTTNNNETSRNILYRWVNIGFIPLESDRQALITDTSVIYESVANLPSSENGTVLPVKEGNVVALYEYETLNNKWNKRLILNNQQLYINLREDTTHNIPANSILRYRPSSQEFIIVYYGDTYTKVNNCLNVIHKIPQWALQPTKPSYTKEEVGLDRVRNVESYSKSETYSRAEINNEITQLNSTITELENSKVSITSYNNKVNSLESNIANLEANKISIADKGVPNGIATLNGNGKVNASQLPDVMLGQLIFGGSITDEGIVTLSESAKEKLGVTDNTIILPTTAEEIKKHEGIYYIASGNGVFDNIDFETGDWILSIGIEWAKIDNSDAVRTVNGKIGNVVLTYEDVGTYSKTSIDSKLGLKIDNSLLGAENGVLQLDDYANIKTGNISNYIFRHRGTLFWGGKIAYKQLSDGTTERIAYISNFVKQDIKESYLYSGKTRELQSVTDVDGVECYKISIDSSDWITTDGIVTKAGSKTYYNYVFIVENDITLMDSTTGLLLDLHANDIVGAIDGYWKKLSGTSGGGGLTKITYNKLKLLRDTKQLIAGMQYQITDYECTTTQIGTASAGHKFDIIVTADNEYTLNENARACIHEGDTYFYNTPLSGYVPITTPITLDYNNTYTLLVEQLPDVGSSVKIGTLDVSTDILLERVSENEINIEAYLVGSIATATFIEEFMGDKIYRLTLSETALTGVVFTPIENDYASLVNYTTGSGDYDEQYSIPVPLNAWEIKYSLDNDVLKYSWADETNGKGVIYYMKDEYNNEAPYDFKNILFKRNVADQNTYYDVPMLDTKHVGMEQWESDLLPSRPAEYLWCYTFNGISPEDDCVDISTKRWTSGFEYMADTEIQKIQNNKILPCTARIIVNNIATHSHVLNDIVFIAYGNGHEHNQNGTGSSWLIQENEIKEQCRHMTFIVPALGNFIRNNTSGVVGIDLYNNTIGSSSRDIILSGAYGCIFEGSNQTICCSSSLSQVKFEINVVNCNTFQIKQRSIIENSDVSFETPISGAYGTTYYFRVGNNIIGRYLYNYTNYKAFKYNSTDDTWEELPSTLTVEV